MMAEKGSIHRMAVDRWYQYDGDAGVLKKLEGVELSHEIRNTLRQNYVDGFMAGFMLRLTGDDDGA
jgi:hypothetical protein